MQVKITCADCGKSLGGFVLTGREHTVEVHPCRCVLDEKPKTGSVREALDAIYEAGGKAWDEVEDPEAFIAELRGKELPDPPQGKTEWQRDHQVDVSRAVEQLAALPDPPAPELTPDELARRQKDVAEYNDNAEEQRFYDEQFDEGDHPDPEGQG